MAIQELITKLRPYGKLDQIQASFAILRGEVPEWPTAFSLKLLEEKDSCVYQLFQSVCSKCWQSEASHRPPIRKIFEHILQGPAPYKKTAQDQQLGFDSDDNQVQVPKFVILALDKCSIAQY